MDQNAKAEQTQRLRSIAIELGAVQTTKSVTLSPPSSPPTFQVPDDERKADAILGQLKLEDSANKPQPKGLRKLSTRTSKSTVPSYDELYAALVRAIDDNVSAGVVEALLKRFKFLDGDINVARRASGGMIRKIRNNENPEERGHLLRSATESSRSDLIQLLAPLADQKTLDESLQFALGKRELQVIETLLRYGMCLQKPELE